MPLVAPRPGQASCPGHPTPTFPELATWIVTEAPPGRSNPIAGRARRGSKPIGPGLPRAIEPSRDGPDPPAGTIRPDATFRKTKPFFRRKLAILMVLRFSIGCANRAPTTEWPGSRSRDPRGDTELR